MKKVLDFLEQHVQWVAIALGVAYLVFMAWTFIIQAPVSVQLGGQTLSPGEIDKEIHDKPVQELQAKINQSRPFAVPKLTWAEDFKTAMDLSRTKPVELAGKPWIDASVLIPGGAPGTGTEQVVGNQEPIAQQPTVPPAVMGPLASGASNVATSQAPGGVDKNWAVATFKIPNKEIAAAFAALKLQKILYNTAVLEVQLMREEMRSDGSWGDMKPIAHLPTAKLLPLPADKATIEDKKNFLAWAAPNQKEILQPGFYQWLKGDPIEIPKAGAPVAAVPEAPPAQAGLQDFDPNRLEYTIEEIKQMTPEQKAQWQKAVAAEKERKRKEAAGKRGGQSGGGRGKGGGAQGGGGKVVDDPDRPDDELPDDVIDPFAPSGQLIDRFYPTYFRQRGRDGGGLPPPQPGQNIPPPPGQAPPPPQGERGDDGGQPAAPPDPATQEHPCPAGFFDPSESPEFWEGWAFDETVQAGKTYRYRVVYKLKSPLFNAASAVKDPKMAEVLALESAPSEWSEPVKIASRTSFYISANFGDEAKTVKFQVFAWQEGAKREKTFEVAPGDMIGGIDNNVNFMTGATLVDIGRDVRTEKSYVLIMDAAGNLSRRDFATDKANPDWENDKRAVAVATTPPAPVAENR